MTTTPAAEPTGGPRIPVWSQGDRLRKARSLTGLTTRDFADRIGISQATVTNAENDHRAVRRITMNAWSLATGVPVEWLEHGVAPEMQNAPDLAVEGGQYAIRDSNPEPADLSSEALIASVGDHLNEDESEQLRQPRRYGHLTAHDGGGEPEAGPAFVCPFRVIPGRAS